MNIKLKSIALDSLSWFRIDLYPGEDHAPTGGGYLAPGRFGRLATPLINRANIRSFTVGGDRYAFEETPIPGSWKGVMDTAVFSAQYGLLLYKHPRPGDSPTASDVMWLETFAGVKVPVDSLLEAVMEAMSRQKVIGK